MSATYMIHVGTDGEVCAGKLTAASPVGSVEIRTDGQWLVVFPPTDPAEAVLFLSALIDQSADLRDRIAERAVTLLAA